MSKLDEIRKLQSEQDIISEMKRTHQQTGHQMRIEEPDETRKLGEKAGSISTIIRQFGMEEQPKLT